MKRYAAGGLAGCVAVTRARATRTRVQIFHAAQASLCPDGGPWVTVCEPHGSICNHGTMEAARSHATDPAGWCEDCREPAGSVAAALTGHGFEHENTGGGIRCWRRRCPDTPEGVEITITAADDTDAQPSRIHGPARVSVWTPIPGTTITMLVPHLADFLASLSVWGNR